MEQHRCLVLTKILLLKKSRPGSGTSRTLDKERTMLSRISGSFVVISH